MQAIEAEMSSSEVACEELTACGPSKATTAAELQRGAATDVPIGWHRHHAALLGGLKATAAPLRRAIKVSAPSFDNGTVVIQVSAEDLVVNGLVRKARARMSCTCMTCGRVGKRRQAGFSDGVLCASCYTERRLRLQLNMMFNAIMAARRSECGVVSEGHVPPLIRCLVADEAWQSLSGPSRFAEAAARVRYLTLAQCEQLIPLLRALQSTIDTALEIPDMVR